MCFRFDLTCLLILLVAFAGCGGPAVETEEQSETTSASTAPEVELTPDEQVAELEQMCAEAGSAMEARQTESTLFERVGGREGLRIVVEDTVRRHLVNEQIKHLLEDVDTDRLVTLVTDFLVVSTGGEGDYHGRNMADAHAHLELTNADFLAAGSDLGAAMEGAGWGEDERQELLCAFVGLRGEVVTR
jgi:hemoglobin